jgi:hypothetical protein
MTEYSVIKGYLCVKSEPWSCNCGSDLHAPECGWEPINKVESLLAEQALYSNRVTWDRVDQHTEIKAINEILNDYGITWPQGATGVRDMAAMAQRDAAQAKIAYRATEALRTAGRSDLANQFDQELDEA